jgi:hypothetical protein
MKASKFSDARDEDPPQRCEWHGLGQQSDALPGKQPLEGRAPPIAIDSLRDSYRCQFSGPRIGFSDMGAPPRGSNLTSRLRMA